MLSFENGLKILLFLLVLVSPPEVFAEKSITRTRGHIEQLLRSGQDGQLVGSPESIFSRAVSFVLKDQKNKTPSMTVLTNSKNAGWVLPSDAGIAIKGKYTFLSDVEALQAKRQTPENRKKLDIVEQRLKQIKDRPHLNLAFEGVRFEPSEKNPGKLKVIFINSLTEVDGHTRLARGKIVKEDIEISLSDLLSSKGATIKFSTVKKDTLLGIGEVVGRGQTSVTLKYNVDTRSLSIPSISTSINIKIIPLVGSTHTVKDSASAKNLVGTSAYIPKKLPADFFDK